MKTLLSLKNLLGLALIAFIIWQVALFLMPAPRQLSYAELGAVESASDAFVEELAAHIEPGHPKRFGLGHLINDGSGQATEILRLALESRSGWEVDPRSIPEAIISDIFGSVIKASSLEEITRSGDRVALDILVAGRVTEVVPTAGGTARARLELYAYDTIKGAQILHREFAATWEPNFIHKVQHGIQDAPLWQRALVWFGAILLLPWITPFLTHWAHSKKTNAASAILLAIYGLLAVLLAGVLMGFQLDGATDWLILAGALILSTGWSYWSCERIAERS
jgi:hypothetical protein